MSKDYDSDSEEYGNFVDIEELHDDKEESIKSHETETKPIVNLQRESNRSFEEKSDSNETKPSSTICNFSEHPLVWILLKIIGTDQNKNEDSNTR